MVTQCDSQNYNTNFQQMGMHFFSTDDASAKSTADRDNPLYESQVRTYVLLLYIPTFQLFARYRFVLQSWAYVSIAPCAFIILLSSSPLSISSLVS